jgi:hypothetical protein
LHKYLAATTTAAKWQIITTLCLEAESQCTLNAKNIYVCLQKAAARVSWFQPAKHRVVLSIKM